MKKRKIGDLIIIGGTGYFAEGIECIVTEVEDGRIIKAKAVNPDPRLARIGFLEEAGEYVIVEWSWSEN
jgi:hypothetical protein